MAFMLILISFAKFLYPNGNGPDIELIEMLEKDMVFYKEI